MIPYVELRADPSIMNNTLTLDMSQSSTNESVTFGFINKTLEVFVLNGEILWPTGDPNSCLAFGGVQNLIYGTPPPPTQVWQLTTNDSGSGSWSNFGFGNISAFNNLTRPGDALGATIDDTGFILGGYISSQTSPAYNGMIGRFSIPGIVAYNMSTGQWSNSSMPQELVRPNGKNGILAAVPTFGTQGLLMATGTGSSSEGALPFDNITIHEPTNRTWHYQTATGSIPRGRDKACTVGIEGDNGTYEVFVYGGQDNPNDGQLTPTQITANKNLDSVHVLSFPGFAWFKADYAPRTNRFYHTCQVVGKRQMLSIGGWDSLDANNGNMSVDPMAQGLEISDLTEMRWSSSYNAEAPPYKTPQVIKDWYKVNASSVQWDDPAVQKFFEKNISAATGFPTSPATSSPTGATSDLINTSAVVGVVIGSVGGVAVLCLLFGLIYLSRRRRLRVTKKDNRHTNSDLETEKAGLPENYPPTELVNNERPYEIDSIPRIELDAIGHAN